MKKDITRGKMNIYDDLQHAITFIYSCGDVLNIHLIPLLKSRLWAKSHNKLHNSQLSRIQYKAEEEEVVCDTDYTPGYI